MSLFASVLKKIRSVKKIRSAPKSNDAHDVWSHSTSKSPELTQRVSDIKESKQPAEKEMKSLSRQNKFYRLKSQNCNLRIDQAEVKYRMMSSKLTRQKRFNTFYKRKLAEVQQETQTH